MATRGPGPASPAEPGDALLERERELAAIDALSQVTIAGTGRVVLIEGPPGIGKSRLLAEARTRAAARGIYALTGRGSELEREFAFGIVRQLFEAMLVRPDARARCLAGSAMVAAPVFESVGVEEDADHVAPSFATLHGLYWLTVNAASDRPLMLSVDDTQWCDQPSLRFLAYLAHRLDGLPLLIAVGLRTGGPQAGTRLLDEIAKAPGTSSIHPAPFSEGAVQTVVRARLGAEPDPAFTAACHQVSGGNPFLVRELLRASATSTCSAIQPEGLSGPPASSAPATTCGSPALPTRESDECEWGLGCSRRSRIRTMEWHSRRTSFLVAMGGCGSPVWGPTVSAPSIRGPQTRE